MPVLLLFLLIALVPAQAIALTGRAEIVVIVDDDVSAHSMGAYGEPEAVSTPNFDALASEGQLYLNAMSSPMCSPTRRGILYGENALQHGVGTFIKLNESLLLPGERPSIAHRLRAQGYRVALVGKSHLAPLDGESNPAQHIAEMGWDEVGALMLGNPRSTLPATPGSPHPVGNHHYYWIETDWQSGAGSLRNVYTTNAITSEAVRLLRDSDPRPLALFVWYSASHFPMNPPPGAVGSCAPTPGSVDPSCYDRAIEHVDTMLADIVAELDWSEDLLIKTSDNGRPVPLAPATEYCGDQSAKGFAKPCGTRVPLVVRGKNVTPGVVSAIVSLTDLHDTLQEFVGAPQTGVESVSFASCFTDPTGCAPRSVVGSIHFSPNGFPLAMYNDETYERYEIGVTTIVAGHLYGLRRWWFGDSVGNTPGDYAEDLWDLGPALSIDRTKRYGQLELTSPTGSAAWAKFVMQQEADRLESTRLQFAPVPTLTPVIRSVLVGGVLVAAVAVRGIRRTSLQSEAERRSARNSGVPRSARSRRSG